MDEIVTEVVLVGQTASPDAEPNSFKDLSEGSVEPTLGKRIRILILKDYHFIVFLDDNLWVQWVTDTEYVDFPSDFGRVTNREGLLEEVSRELLTDRQRAAFQRLLGESIARLLDDKKSDNAVEILDKAEEYLKARTTERARMWYVSAMGIAVGLALIGGLVLWLVRDWMRARVGLTAFDLALSASAGALGSMISVALRLGALNVDAWAGKTVHHFEGVLRAIAGMAGGLLLALAVKSNLILGTINASDKSLVLLLAVAVVAGASERVVPDLIKKAEGTILK